MPRHCAKALRQKMASDNRVFIIGEDAGVYGRRHWPGLSMNLIQHTQYRSPILGGQWCSAAPGLVCGPGEIQFMDFAAEPEQLGAASGQDYVRRQGRRASMVRMPGGSGTTARPPSIPESENWFVHVPGPVVMPATPL